MVTALLCAATLHLTGLELELAGGLAHSLESNSPTYDYPIAVPALEGRVAVVFGEHWSAGASFLGVIGGEAPNTTGCCGTNSGNRAFSATAATFVLRGMTAAAPRQWWLEGGVGTGHLISLQTDSSFEHPPNRGHAGVTTRLAGGVRWPAGSLGELGLEIAWLLWTQVEHGSGGGIAGVAAQSGLTTSAVLLMLTVSVPLFGGR